MKKTITQIILTIFIILTILNSIFFIEILKNQDLKEFYFQDKELSDEYLEKEKIHMQEVKDLTINSFIFNLLLLIPLFFLKNYISLKQTGISLITISIIFFIAAIFFKQFFHNFHLIFFNSTNWLLPSNSKLIQTYPLTFFRNRFILFNSINLIIGLILIKKSS
tara:strand:- start:3175 stop:3666 length:492 start_codon:yes stop_codon:yes gene_type:complete